MRIPVMTTFINSFQEKKLLEEGMINFSQEEKNQLINILAGLKQVGLADVTDEFILTYHKEMKSNVMSDECENAILGGFTATNGHFYRTNRDDQVNLIGQKDLLMDSDDQVVPWKTENNGYIMHTREEWLKVYIEAFQHKRTQLYKYNTLKMQIMAAASHEEVLAINWTEPEPEPTPEPTPVDPPATDPQPEEPETPVEEPVVDPVEPVPTEPEAPVEEPAPTDPVEEPIPTEPVEEPVVTEPPTEEPVPTEPPVEEPVTEPVVEEPAPTEPVVEEPVTEPAPEEPPVEEPITEPAPEEPVVGAQSFSTQSVQEEPVVSKKTVFQMFSKNKK